MENIDNVVKMISEKRKITYEQFISLISQGYEMQFFYKKRKFGSTQFDGYEFYEWNIEKGYQTYKTIGEFKDKINIDGTPVRELWSDVKKIDFAE